MVLNHTRDRAAAAAWAKDLLGRQDWLVLDFETNGMGGEAEIVEIGMLEPGGQVLLDTLLRPAAPIPPEVTAIHGITDGMVADARTFPAVYAEFAALCAGRTIVSYNVEFDRTILEQTCTRYGLPMLKGPWSCAMLQYAAYCGELRAGSYRYQKLLGAGHRAVGDCRVALRLIETMATSTALCVCRTCQRARAAAQPTPAAPVAPAA